MNTKQLSSGMTNMGKFAKYRVHFDMRKTGFIMASSDAIKPDQVEEYQRVFGCGQGWVSDLNGVTYWQADPPDSDENARRLAKEWLDELERTYPNKANIIMAMLK